MQILVERREGDVIGREAKHRHLVGDGLVHLLHVEQRGTIAELRQLDALLDLGLVSLLDRVEQLQHHAREHGKSKYGASRFLKGFVDLLTVVFLTRYTLRPLHVFDWTCGLVDSHV